MNTKHKLPDRATVLLLRFSQALFGAQGLCKWQDGLIRDHELVGYPVLEE